MHKQLSFYKKFTTKMNGNLENEILRIFDPEEKHFGILGIVTFH
jgi:hypothetical protein